MSKDQDTERDLWTSAVLTVPWRADTLRSPVVRSLVVDAGDPVKKLLVLLAVVAVAVFFLRGSEAAVPSYYLVEIEVPSGQTSRTMTLVEKLRPGVACRGLRSTPLLTGFLEKCDGCRKLTESCSTNLSETHLRAFDGDVLSVPYFSYEWGGLLRQQDFRILFPGVPKEDADTVCIQLKNYLHDLLFVLGGEADCVRQPGVL